MIKIKGGSQPCVLLLSSFLPVISCGRKRNAHRPADLLSWELGAQLGGSLELSPCPLLAETVYIGMAEMAR